MAKPHRPVGRWNVVVALNPGDAAETPLFLQIARALIEDIRRGRLKPGARLPGSRSLAASLAVHRNTVIAAYNELLAEGWIEARHGRGTFVSSALPGQAPKAFARKAAHARMDALGFSLRGAQPAVPAFVATPKGCIRMYGGVPDARLTPVAALSRAYRRQLRKVGEGLSYGDPLGHVTLRRALATMLAETRGLSIAEDNVMITRGSQMALYLSARTFLSPGDRVAVEAWGYRPAWEAFKQAGAELLPIHVDAQGLDVDALAAEHARAPIRAVYLTPHHQYPTTVQLSPGRRLQLLSLAQQQRFAIVEDDYDHEFHYDGRPLLPLASADHAGVVVYIGTLSKVLAPGLRLGYLVAPRALLSRASDLRCYVDRQGDHVTEAAVAELIEDGELQRHIRRTRRVYQARRDQCVSALNTTFGDRLRFDVPNGGMALWAEAEAKVDVNAWFTRALQAGVAFQPARHFAFSDTLRAERVDSGKHRPFLRLGYACLNEREIKEAVKRLRQSL